MNKWSIKAKLNIVFSIILFFVLFLSGYSIYNTHKLSDGFIRYKDMSKNILLASDIQFNMLKGLTYFKDYIKTMSTNDINDFHNSYIKTTGLIEKLLEKTQNHTQLLKFIEMLNELKKYDLSFSKVVNYMNERNEITHNNFDIHGAEMIELLSEVAYTSTEDKVSHVALNADNGIHTVLLVRLYTVKYLTSSFFPDAKRAKVELQNLRNNLLELQKEMENLGRIADIKRVIELIDIYEKGLDRVVVIIRESDKIIQDELNFIGLEIGMLVENVQTSIQAEQEKIGKEVLKLDKSIISTSVLVSSLVLLFVLLLSYLISRNIGHSLSLLHIAIKNLLSKRNRSARINISTTDEISAISQDFNLYLKTIENDYIEDEKLIEKAKLIAQGNYETIIYPRNDEDTLGLLLQNITQTLKDFAKITNSVANGDLQTSVEVKSENDILAISLNKMVDILKDVAQKADEISRGNYDLEIIPKNNKDILSIALQKMTLKLRSLFNEREITEWTQTAQVNVANILRLDTTVELLSQNLLEKISQYTNAFVGSLYMKDDEYSLELSAVYAHANKKSLQRKIELGEGIVGQAAKEDRIIIMKHVPKDYISIQSSLGQSVSLHLIVIPFSYKGDLRGVLELGYFEEIDTKIVSLLELLRESFGIAFENILAKDRLHKALFKEQSISEELQVQEEELRVSNESLVIQSKKLQAQKDALEQSAIEIKTKAREIELASKYKSEFLANMSHELRTPLNSLLILAYSLSLNEENHLSKDEVESAEVIYESGQHLLSLINDVLDIAKVEAGKMVINQERINSGELLHDINKRFAHMAKDKNITFETIKSENMVHEFISDKVKVTQILTNLISNALKFTKEGGVFVNLLRHENQLYFSVRDDGIGIEIDKQATIFEAFKQADNSTTRTYGGTGLGLSIALNFAKLLGGNITLKSELGVGSEFTLILPCIVGIYEATKPIEQEYIVMQEKMVFLFLDDRESLDKTKPLFLIIEDDMKFAKILYNSCKEKGYQAIVAVDGESGLNLASQYDFSGIILDYMLPGYNGADILTLLKQNPKTQYTPVHIMSAVDNLMNMKELGAIGQLTKPVSKEQIHTVLEELKKYNNDLDLLLLNIEDASLQELLTKEKVSFSVALDTTQGLKLLQENTYSAIILGINLSNMQDYHLLENIEENKNIINKPPIIICTDRELNDAEYDKLQSYSQRIIVDSLASQERLLDEISLFTNHAKKNNLSQTSQETNMHLSGKVVLLVDDDMRNTYALAKILRQRSLTVHIASGGKRALNLLEEIPKIDIILMDIMMPEMDGYETIQEIKKNNFYDNIPIVALTANAMSEDKQKCLNAGANDYITKPVNIDKLIVMIQMWL